MAYHHADAHSCDIRLYPATAWRNYMWAGYPAPDSGNTWAELVDLPFWTKSRYYLLRLYRTVL